MNPFDHPALEEIDAISALLYDVGGQLELDPTAWSQLWDDPLMQALAFIEVPADYNRMPNCGGLFGAGPVSYLNLLGVSERIARHDANCALAMPTPGMGGFAFSVLGNEDQKEQFFKRYLDDRPKRNFFAITEPQVGSDATHGLSAIHVTPNGLELNAHKKLVGSVPQGEIGLIFVKDERTKSHKLVIVDEAMLSTMKISRLKTLGLRGADLGELEVSGMEIPDTAILGHGQTLGLRDGFFAMNRVFAQYRPMVTTMALGVARGIMNDLSECKVAPLRLEHSMLRYKTLLARVVEVGLAMENGTPKVHETSRLKLEAIRFLDQVVHIAFETMPAAEIAQHKRLLKRCRDARSFEYMEGTTNIHLGQAFRSYSASA